MALKENEYYENCLYKTHVLREEFSELSKNQFNYSGSKAANFLFFVIFRRWSKC
jgi:hypothetical protein